MDIARALNRLIPGAQWSLDIGAQDLSSLVFHDNTDPSTVPSMAQIHAMHAQILAEDAQKRALEAKYGHLPSFLEKLCNHLKVDHSAL